MELMQETILFYVDSQLPQFGETTYGAILNGAEESYFHGKTEYTNGGSRRVFTDRREAIDAFHLAWPDRCVVEKYLKKIYGTFAVDQIQQIYGNSGK